MPLYGPESLNGIGRGVYGHDTMGRWGTVEGTVLGEVSWNRIVQGVHREIRTIYYNPFLSWTAKFVKSSDKFRFGFVFELRTTLLTLIVLLPAWLLNSFMCKRFDKNTSYDQFIKRYNSWCHQGTFMIFCGSWYKSILSSTYKSRRKFRFNQVWVDQSSFRIIQQRRVVARVWHPPIAYTIHDSLNYCLRTFQRKLTWDGN